MKAKAEKELEAEKLLKEQKIKVIILCRAGKLVEALLSLNDVISGRVFINCVYYRQVPCFLFFLLGLFLKA